MNNIIDISICQMISTKYKEQNIKKARIMIEEAANNGADIIVLPEIFNSPYQAKLFPEYAEPFPGPTTNFLSRMARAYQVCIVGGSIIEKDDKDHIYNTSYVFDDKGDLIGKHRKMHLFDIDIPGKVTFKESETLDAGNNIVVCQYKSVKFGLMICYDVRFPEMARAMALEGAHMIIIPAAFTFTTGSVHWDLSMRCRAVDNQVFVIAASPARDAASSYKVWGHSMVVDPWGTVIAQAGAEEEVLHAKIDLTTIDRVRNELPLIKHRRTDLYNLKYKLEG